MVTRLFFLSLQFFLIGLQNHFSTLLCTKQDNLFEVYVFKQAFLNKTAKTTELLGSYSVGFQIKAFGAIIFIQ